MTEERPAVPLRSNFINFQKVESCSDIISTWHMQLELHDDSSNASTSSGCNSPFLTAAVADAEFGDQTEVLSQQLCIELPVLGQ